MIMNENYFFRVSIYRRIVDWSKENGQVQVTQLTGVVIIGSGWLEMGEVCKGENK